MKTADMAIAQGIYIINLMIYNMGKLVLIDIYFNPKTLLDHGIWISNNAVGCKEFILLFWYTYTLCMFTYFLYFEISEEKQSWTHM